MNKINGFANHRWLSNFARVTVTFDGVEYASVEHAYQAAKTVDLLERARIATLGNPGDAKRAGKTLTVSSCWPTRKLAVMSALLEQKFKQSPYRELLLATGEAVIEEANYWGDTFWGTCNGKGENHLGRLLMELRERLADAALA